MKKLMFLICFYVVVMVGCKKSNSIVEIEILRKKNKIKIINNHQEYEFNSKDIKEYKLEQFLQKLRLSVTKQKVILIKYHKYKFKKVLPLIYACINTGYVNIFFEYPNSHTTQMSVVPLNLSCGELKEGKSVLIKMLKNKTFLYKDKLLQFEDLKKLIGNLQTKNPAVWIDLSINRELFIDDVLELLLYCKRHKIRVFFYDNYNKN